MIEWSLRGLSMIRDVDHGISQWIGRRAPSPLDVVMSQLSAAANHSKLWLVIAAALAVRKGATRRAALRGVLSIAATSVTANAVLKPLLPRRRPPAQELNGRLKFPPAPTSSSFPSGHAASAAAFATGVALECPKAGLAIAPLAAAVAYSRVHIGVHWASDVVVGAAVGSGVALGTRRWWPVRTTDEAQARPRDDAPVLPDGAGLVLVANQRSGDPRYDPASEISEALPAATVLRAEDGRDLYDQLEAALEASRGAARAVGVAGGDGTVAAAVAIAGQHGLPLVVVPTGTLNHFARDVGVYDLQEAVDATQAGEAVAVNVAAVDIHNKNKDGRSDTRYFLNTASLGGYSDLVRLREKWERKWGKWPAFTAALIMALRHAAPIRVRLDGIEQQLWILFVGNGPYYPRGMVPAWRPQLDSGLLDIRYLRADRRFSRIRAVIALALGALHRSRTYVQREAPSLDVELIGDHAYLATDGEVMDKAGRFTFRIARHPITVYRRNEDNWPDRPRPHHPW
ncbi:MAG TPA: phosphatase PAP2 family protein [Pseudonocardiaceae bacterium]|nr:phosphatase PAP2 family protein [Pseudonocardiaceae bacterium]